MTESDPADLLPEIIEMREAAEKQLEDYDARREPVSRHFLLGQIDAMRRFELALRLKAQQEGSS